MTASSAGVASLKTTLEDGILKFGAHNLFLNSAVGVSQSISVRSGVTYRVGFRGTGTITFSGGATGALNGSSANDLVAMTIVAFGTSITCTVSGSVTEVRLHRHPAVETYIETADSIVYAPRLWNEPRPLLGLDGPFDYYIDAKTGEDSNDGASIGTAWASLSKISSALLTDGQKKRVLVKAGLYDSGDSDTVNVTSASFSSETSLEIVFERGCVMNGASVTNSYAFEFGGVGNRGSYTIYGNGLLVTGLTVPSANSIGTRGQTTTNVHDVRIADGEDGVSAHQNAAINLHNVVIEGDVVRPMVHVDDSVVNAEYCTFRGLVDYRDDSRGELRDCILDPAGANQNLQGDVTLTRCQIGDLSHRYELYSGGDIVFEDCFVNLYADMIGEDSATLTRCFGLFSARARTYDLTIENSVFTGPATGLSNTFFSNFDPGAGGAWIIKNNIFSGAYTFMVLDPANAGYIAAASTQFHNNILSDGKTYDADLIAAGADIQGSIPDDPLIGIADTLQMVDYAFTAGSPAEAAGVGGGDIGFGAESVSERRPASTGAKGLVVERGAVNRFPHSNDFTASNWTKTRAVISENLPGPDGEHSASKFSDNDASGAGAVYMHDSLSLPDGPVTLSILAKADQSNWLRSYNASMTTIASGYLGIGDPPSVGTLDSDVDMAEIYELSDGWVQCSISWDIAGDADKAGPLRFLLAEADGDSTVSLDGTNSILLSQAGALDSPHSLMPIPTLGSSVATQDDDLRIINPGWLQLSPASGAFEMELHFRRARGGELVGGTPGQALARVDPSGDIEIDNGTTALTISGRAGSVLNDDHHKLIVVWDGSTRKACLDGGEVAGDSNAILDTQPTDLHLLSNSGSSAFPDGVITRLEFRRRSALPSDVELQARTR